MKIITLILALALTPAPFFAQNIDAYLKGVSLLEFEKYNEAIEPLNQAVADNQFIRNSKSRFYRGIALYKAALTQQAIDDFTFCRTSNDEAVIWLAKCKAQNKNYDQSISLIRHYLERSPIATLSSILADPDFESLIQTPEWQDFSSEYQETDEKEAISEINYLIKTHDNTDRAILLAEQAFDENMAEFTHLLKAEIYHSRNLYQLEIYEWEQALASSPNNVDYLKKQGQGFFQTEQYKKAIKNYKMCLQISPELFKVRKALASAFYLDGDYAAAQRQIDIYMAYFENDKDALLLSSKINFELGNSTQSLKAINKLFNSGDEIQADWYFTRGEIYYNTGSYQYAAKDFSMYLDLIPDNKDANLFMGNAQKKMGLDDSACFYWKRAARYGSYEAIEYLQEYCE